MGELSNTAKGRWVAAATVGIVTFTWMWAAGGSAATGVLAAGILIGGPYALVAGTVIGAIAGRLGRHRELVLVIAALVTALGLDSLPLLFMRADEWSNDPVMVTCFVLSLIPTIGCALWLERWTRPRADVAPAIVARQTR